MTLLVDTHTPLGPLLEHPVTVWIGRRGYGIYLGHVPLLWLFDEWQPTLRDLGIRSGPGLLVTLGASVGVAAFSYEYIESPFLRLKPR